MRKACAQKSARLPFFVETRVQRIAGQDTSLESHGKMKNLSNGRYINKCSGFMEKYFNVNICQYVCIYMYYDKN